MSERISSGEQFQQAENLEAKVFSTQEAMQVKQAIKEAGQMPSWSTSEPRYTPQQNVGRNSEIKGIPQSEKEQPHSSSMISRPPEIHSEEAQAKIYTAKQLADVRKAIALEQVRIAKNNE